MALIEDPDALDAAREPWRRFVLEDLLDHGVIPGHSADKLAEMRGLKSKSPFWRCYASMSEFREDILKAYEQDLLNHESAIRHAGGSPALLQVLASVIQDRRTRDQTVGWWARSQMPGAELAAEVVARRTRRIVGSALEAVSHLGYEGVEAQAVGKTIANTLINALGGKDDVALDDDEFRALVDVVTRGGRNQAVSLEKIDFGGGYVIFFSGSREEDTKKIAEAAKAFFADKLGLKIEPGDADDGQGAAS